MENPTKNTPRDVFMYLLVTAALYASVVSFIALWFAYIDVLAPDQLGYCYTCSLNQIRWASSVLVVVFPVFALVFRWLRKVYLQSPDKRELKVRKWLMHFTLFLAAVTIIVDLITLIFNFYSGELTLRFLLKTLVVLAIAAAVFGYYIWDIKKGASGGRARIVTWLTSLAIILSVIGGFFVVGSPATQRDRRFDEHRVNDLMTIQGQVVSFWQQKSRLPAKLEELRDDLTGFEPSVDPQSGEPYGYAVKGLLKFELCAMFETKGQLGQQNFRARGVLKPIPISDSYIAGPFRQNWDHGVGRTCFDRAIDPDLYKIEKPRPL